MGGACKYSYVGWVQKIFHSGSPTPEDQTWNSPKQWKIYDLPTTIIRVVQICSFLELLKLTISRTYPHISQECWKKLLLLFKAALHVKSFLHVMMLHMKCMIDWG